MRDSLILKEYIDPKDLEQLPITKEDVAKVVGTSEDNINGWERWSHMLAVYTVNGLTFASYRQLPGWANAGKLAIARCTEVSQLEEFGAIVKAEKERFEYSQPTLEDWRQAWAAKRTQLEAQAEQRQQQKARQQQGENWKAGWQQVLCHCQQLSVLEQLRTEAESQCQFFADLPETIEAVAKIWQQRWNQLCDAA
jgi:hypothetical protein